MFATREQRSGRAGVVDVAFTDRYGGVSAPPRDSLDLSRTRPGRDDELAANAALLAKEFGVDGFCSMRQVHGTHVVVVDAPAADPPVCDALVTSAVGLPLLVRVGDCVPVVLADPDTGTVGVVHAGRVGVAAGVVPAAVRTMRSRGADRIEAWVGPHICGGCYEVPASLRAEVAAVVPAAYACTTWGSPSLDLGAAVVVQLGSAGCAVNDRSACTAESPSLYSHRRDGARAGRSAGVVVLRRGSDGGAANGGGSD
jgi:purine-nucleoside/S-methyl-5'-thioadenosine phosphorylase / adenosine deaminase